jgi:N4-gp56 family major capsid protein
MASTTLPADLDVTRYSSLLARETFSKTLFAKLSGPTIESPIVRHMDLEKGAGDTIQHGLRIATRAAGRIGDDQLKEFEAAMTFYGQSFVIQQMRQGHEFRGMAQQRTVYELWDEAKASLSDWWGWMLDASFLAYGSGYVGTVAGNAECISTGWGNALGHVNAVTAPDAAHVETTGAVITLSDIDTCVEMAKTTNPRIFPVNIDGGKYFVLILHPYSAYNLRTEIAAATYNNRVNWMDIQQQVGPQGKSNPIFTGAMGVYNNVVIHESEFVPRAASLTYNLFMGQSAISFAMGNAHKNARGSSNKGQFFSWRERLDDYDNIMGIGTSAIWGMQANIYNSARLGTISLTTTCVAH